MDHPRAQAQPKVFSREAWIAKSDSLTSVSIHAAALDQPVYKFYNTTQKRIRQSPEDKGHDRQLPTIDDDVGYVWRDLYYVHTRFWSENQRNNESNDDHHDRGPEHASEHFRITQLPLYHGIDTQDKRHATLGNCDKVRPHELTPPVPSLPEAEHLPPRAADAEPDDDVDDRDDKPERPPLRLRHVAGSEEHGRRA